MINGIRTKDKYNALLMSYQLGVHGISEFYDITSHDEYILRGRPSFAPCELEFMVQGNNEIELMRNISGLRKELEKCTFLIQDDNYNMLTCYGVYNNHGMDEKFIDFLTNKWTQRVLFSVEVFRKEGAEEKVQDPNNGDAPAKPQFNFIFAGNSQNVNVSFNGKNVLSLVGPFVANDTVVIDAINRKVTKNGVNDMSVLSSNTLLEDVLVPTGNYTMIATGLNGEVLMSYKEVFL